MVLHLLPIWLLLWNYGFGGATNKFRQGGLLHQIALEHNVLPKWLLVGTTTEPWDEYENTGADIVDCGREFAGERELYKYNSELKKPA